MRRIALLTVGLLNLVFMGAYVAAGLYAQTVKPTLPPPPLYKGEAIATNANVIDSFYLYDAAGNLLATCKSHDLDTNTFKGCQLGEGITLDDLLGIIFSKELQRLYDKERIKP